MRLFIDDMEADTDSGSQVSLSLALVSLAEPGRGKTGYARSVTIPMTARNAGIMGGCEDVNARDRFNDKLHTCRIEFSGCVVMDGAVHLTECRRSVDGEGYYRFNVIGSSRFWADHASSNPLSSLFPSLSVTMSAESIMESWVSDSIIKFLPVQRDIYNGPTGAIDQDREFGLPDYHPFVCIYPLIEEIFTQAGYGLVSRFLDTPLFRSLYIGGKSGYSYVNGSGGKADFRAGRFEEAVATADYLGRVYANPYTMSHSIGNIADTADPAETRNGVSVPGVFDNGGYFKTSGARVAFIPDSEMSVGFKYEIEYVTEYGFKNKDELWGFDTFYIGDGETRKVTISNPYQDRKKSFRANREFRVIIPGHTSGSYRFGAYSLINPGADPDNLQPEDYDDVTIAEFMGSSAVVSTATSGDYVYVYLMHTAGTVTGLLPEDAWLLYDGYVQETGKTNVSAVLTGSVRTVSPQSPKYFDSMYFSGAAEGMEFTVGKAFVSPVFGAGTETADISFGSIVPAGASRMDLLNGIRHMFNLCFYTNNLEKKVYAEPMDVFFDGPVVDWSDRADLSRPSTLQELGDEVGRKITFGYKDGDGAVLRTDELSGVKFGTWSAAVGHLYATEKETLLESPLFAPSVNSTGNLLRCPSASLVNAGNKDKTGEFDFPMKIIGYAGMTELPPGESWTWPGNGNSYPLAAFHYPASGDGFTLCFEDRDSLKGLNGYWTPVVEAYNTGRRLALWLRLGADDIEAILYPNSLKRDFRACYKLLIDGEISLWRLEEVRDYNPSSPSTMCIFIKT